MDEIAIDRLDAPIGRIVVAAGPRGLTYAQLESSAGIPGSDMALRGTTARGHVDRAIGALEVPTAQLQLDRSHEPAALRRRGADGLVPPFARRGHRLALVRVALRLEDARRLLGACERTEEALVVHLGRQQLTEQRQSFLTSSDLDQ